MTDLSKAYRAAKLGDVLEVWATDPAAKNDIQAWATHTGNDILEIADEKDYARIVVQVTKKRT
jgi:TusA-related sulfurtransferase